MSLIPFLNYEILHTRGSGCLDSPWTTLIRDKEEEEEGLFVQKQDTISYDSWLYIYATKNYN